MTHSIAIYGPRFCVYNIHSLIHLYDDLEHINFTGTLESLSAFPFENSFIHLKKAIKSPNQPIRQFINKVSQNFWITEDVSKKIHFSNKSKTPAYTPVYLKNYISYKNVTVKSVLFSCKIFDSFFSDNEYIYQIVGIFDVDGQPKFLCYKLLNNVTDFYTYPIKSSLLGIHKYCGPLFVSTVHKSLFVKNVHDIQFKYLCLAIPDMIDQYVFFPMNSQL